MAGLPSPRSTTFGPRLDYDIGELRAGFGSAAGRIGYSIGPVLRHIRLFDDPYVTEYGGQTELLFGRARSANIRLRLEGVYQNYDGSGFPGNDADGLRFDLSAAYEARAGSRGYFTVGAAAEYKDADERKSAIAAAGCSRPISTVSPIATI